MNDEQTFAALGDAEHDAQQIPPRWRRLAEGEATATEVADLQAEAHRDSQAALLWERFRPLTDQDDHAIADAMLAEQRRPRRRAWSGPATWIGAGAAAAAAAAFAWAGLPNEPRLPHYDLLAATPDIGYRGATASPTELPRHHEGSALSLVVRPESPVATPIAVQAFQLEADRAVSLPTSWEVSEAGAARLDGPVSEILPGRRGEVTILALIRAAGRDPISEEELWLAHRAGRPPTGTQWVRYRMQVVTD